MSSGPDTCNSQWALLLVVIRNKKTLTVGQLWLVLANQNIGRQYIWHLIRWEICHRSAEGAQKRYYPISVKAALCSMLSAQCTHLCTRLGNYQLCTLSFTVVANFFLDSHPWQTNFHSIRIILEDNRRWHSRHLINEASREKTDHFQKSHLT